MPALFLFFSLQKPVRKESLVGYSHFHNVCAFMRGSGRGRSFGHPHLQWRRKRSPTQNDLCTHLCPDKCIGEQVTRRTLQWSVDSVGDICHLKFIQVKNESAKCHQASFHITRRARRGCITNVSWVKWAPSDWLKWASEVGGSVKRALLKNYKRWAIAVTCSYHFFSFTIRGCWWFIWENCWSVQIKWSGIAEWSVSSLLTTISVAFPWTLPLL